MKELLAVIHCKIVIHVFLSACYRMVRCYKLLPVWVQLSALRGYQTWGLLPVLEGQR